MNRGVLELVFFFSIEYWAILDKERVMRLFEGITCDELSNFLEFCFDRIFRVLVAHISFDFKN